MLVWEMQIRMVVARTERRLAEPGLELGNRELRRDGYALHRVKNPLNCRKVVQIHLHDSLAAAAEARANDIPFCALERGRDGAA
jgi:hypothetical protein